MIIKEKRFQDCNKIEKLWRYRYYSLIPFMFIKTKILNLIYNSEKTEDHISNVKLWKILIGVIQFKMKYYYTMKEVEEKFKRKRFEKLKNIK